jgi:hypothetical protein
MIENTLEHIGTGNNFMSRTYIAQQSRNRIHKWDCIKLKSFCTAKKAVTRLKGQPTEWEKIFGSYTSDKGLTTKIYMELRKLTLQRINNSLNKWANEPNRQFSRELQMTNKYMKKCSTSLAIKETQNKMTLRFHLTPMRMAIFYSTSNNQFWWG